MIIEDLAAIRELLTRKDIVDISFHFFRSQRSVIAGETLARDEAHLFGRMARAFKVDAVVLAVGST